MKNKSYRSVWTRRLTASFLSILLVLSLLSVPGLNAYAAEEEQISYETAAVEENDFPEEGNLSESNSEGTASEMPSSDQKQEEDDDADYSAEQKPEDTEASGTTAGITAEDTEAPGSSADQNAGGTEAAESIPSGSPVLKSAPPMLLTAGEEAEADDETEEDGTAYRIIPAVYTKLIQDEYSEAGTITAFVNGAKTEEAKAGDTVKLEVKGASGFVFDTVTMRPVGGSTAENVTLTADESGKYPFEMPRSDVRIYVTFTHSHDGENFAPWGKDSAEQGALPGKSDGSRYYLVSDITINTTENESYAWLIPSLMHLCLNGHTVTLNKGASGIVLGGGSTMELYDCAGGGVINGTGRTVIRIGDSHGGDFTMHGGTIRNGGGSTNLPGGGVFVGGGSTFTMYGGSITDNIAENSPGAGVYAGGTFTMSGGTISGNTAGTNGGGVYVAGTFNMSGGTISGNAAGTDGGGVHAVGTFNMSGGTISGNTAGQYGGGVCVGALNDSNPGSFTMSGGTSISGNTALNGGGISLQRTASASVGSGCMISDNKAEGGYGGGVHLADWAHADLDRCVITGNTAKGLGGGLAVTDNLTYEGTASTSASAVLNDVTITGNSAAGGGGAYLASNDGDLTVKGSTKITGNTKGNLYLSGGQYQTLVTADTLTDGAKIGISTGNTITNSNPQIVVSEGYQEHNGDTDPTQFFTSDNTAYSVLLSEDGEVAIGKHVHTWYLYAAGEDKAVTYCRGGDSCSLSGGVQVQFINHLLTEATGPIKEDYDGYKKELYLKKSTLKSGYSFPDDEIVLNGITYYDTTDGGKTQLASGTYPTDAGTYVAESTVRVNGNVTKETDLDPVPAQEVVISQTITINKLEAEAGVTGFENLSYTGKAQTLAKAEYDTEKGRILYRLGTDGAWTDTAPKASEIGSYDIYWYFEGGRNYKDIGSADAPQSVTATIYEGHEHDGISFTPWVAADTLPTASGSYFLSEDVALSEMWSPEANADIKLCLNGKIISGGDFRFLNLSSGQKVTIYAPEEGGTIRGFSDSSNGTLVVGAGAELTICGGTITEFSGSGTGTIVVNGTMTMNGGTITGCSYTGSSANGAVRVNGTLAILGAPVITGNTANGSEANVDLKNATTVDGGKWIGASYIMIAGKLTDGASVGVTRNGGPGNGMTPVRFTENYKDVMGEADPSEYFSSDVTDYYIDITEEGVDPAGEAKLMIHTHEWTLMAKDEDEDGETETAVVQCTAAGCPYEGEHYVKLTAEGGTYDGTAKPAVVEWDRDFLQNEETPTGDIPVTFSRYPDSYRMGSEALPSAYTAPTDAGTYTALLRVDCRKGYSDESNVQLLLTYTIDKLSCSASMKGVEGLEYTAKEQTLVTVGEFEYSSKISWRMKEDGSWPDAWKTYNSSVVDQAYFNQYIAPNTNPWHSNYSEYLAAMQPLPKATEAGDYEIQWWAESSWDTNYADYGSEENPNILTVTIADAYVHIHSWEVSADGNVAKVKCVEDNCPYTTNKVYKAELMMEGGTYKGAVYYGYSIKEDGFPEEASVKEITYWTSTGTEIRASEAGTFIAKMDVEVPDGGDSTKSATAEQTFTIEPKEIGLTWTDTELTYNSRLQGPKAEFTGVYGKDRPLVNLNYEAGSRQRNVGTYEAVASGVSYHCYKLPDDLDARTTEYTIAPLSVSITNLTAEDKEYDGTNAAETGDGAEIDGMYWGDRVTIKTGTAAFSDAAVGDNKTVTFTGYALEGEDAVNYELAAQPDSAAASITKKNLTVSGLTAKDKKYDANTDAELSGTPVLEGVVGSEEVSLDTSAMKAAFADSAVQDDKTVTVSGLALTGKDAGNYELNALELTASIKEEKNLLDHWEWTEDCSAATAVFKSDYDGHLVEVPAKVTSETVAAKCEEDGKTTYIAEALYEDEEYEDSQTKVLPAAGHSFGSWSVERKAEEGKTGARVRVCANDETHTDREEYAYTFVSGENGSWKKESADGFALTVKRTASDSETFGLFESISIDGTALAADDFTAKAGSLDAVISATSMEKLSVGKHTVLVSFADGSAVTEVEVTQETEKKDDSSTDDSSTDDSGADDNGKSGTDDTDKKDDNNKSQSSENDNAKKSDSDSSKNNSNSSGSSRKSSAVSNTSSGSRTAATSRSAKTGDASGVIGWILMMFIAAVVSCAAVYARRRRKN